MNAIETLKLKAKEVAEKRAASGSTKSGDRVRRDTFPVPMTSKRRDDIFHVSQALGLSQSEVINTLLDEGL